MSNFDFTATRKNKVATFITNDITGDIITYDRRGELIAHYDYCRWLWLRDLKDPTDMNPKLIQVEDVPFPLTPEAFKIDKLLSEGEFISGDHVYTGKEFFERVRLVGMPRSEFVKYWENRLGLASNAYHRFKKIIEATRKKKEKQAKLETPEEVSRKNRDAANKRWERIRQAQKDQENQKNP
jgi:hypothetical protein